MDAEIAALEERLRILKNAKAEAARNEEARKPAVFIVLQEEAPSNNLSLPHITLAAFTTHSMATACLANSRLEFGMQRTIERLTLDTTTRMSGYVSD
jgi:hypothetical protein